MLLMLPLDFTVNHEKEAALTEPETLAASLKDASLS